MPLCPAAVPPVPRDHAPSSATLWVWPPLTTTSQSSGWSSGGWGLARRARVRWGPAVAGVPELCEVGGMARVNHHIAELGLVVRCLGAAQASEASARRARTGPATH